MAVNIRIKDLKEKFDDIYNYIEEYKTIRPIMEGRIESLETEVQLLRQRVTDLENQ